MSFEVGHDYISYFRNGIENKNKSIFKLHNFVAGKYICLFDWFVVLVFFLFC